VFKYKHTNITDLSQVFLEPAKSTQRQYEALRAYLVDHLSSKEAARRFGYSPGSFRVLTYDFRQNPDRPFFIPPAKGPKEAPKTDPLRQQIIQARKQNLSIYDIQNLLDHEGHKLSAVRIASVLKEEGFARLPRGADDERPAVPQCDQAAKADVRQLDLTPRHFRTQFGGLFLFVPYLVSIPWEKIFGRNGFPGTKMIFLIVLPSRWT